MSEHYLGNPLLRSSNVTLSYDAKQVKEFIKCAEDPLYFMETYIKIVHVDKGLIPFKMYPFQKRIIKTIHDNRFSIAKLPRQSGKSTSVVGYLLHYCIFNPTASVAILANKGNTAKELLDRFKLAYENLPKWLQHGIVEWNKFSIKLENGAKIIAAATSSSAIRGSSLSMIVLDEYGFVPNNVAEEFFSSVYPTISSGTTTKMVIISTPNGMNHFYKIWMDAQLKRNNFVPVEAFWMDVPGRDAEFKKQTIANTSQRQWEQEFECVNGNTIIEIYDKKTKKHHKMRIKDFYDFCL